MQTYESECSYSSEEMEQFQTEVKQLHTQMKQLKVNTNTKHWGPTQEQSNSELYVGYSDTVILQQV